MTLIQKWIRRLRFQYRLFWKCFEITQNKRLSETVDKIYKNIIPESVLRDVIINTPLSAKKVDAGNNKPDIYPLKTASIPYSSAAVTLGRKVIRNLCGLKDFGDLSYT